MLWCFTKWQPYWQRYPTRQVGSSTTTVKHHGWELEWWLSGEESLLLFQKTRFSSQHPYRVAHNLRNPVSDNLTLSYDLSAPRWYTCLHSSIQTIISKQMNKNKAVNLKGWCWWPLGTFCCFVRRDCMWSQFLVWGKWCHTKVNTQSFMEMSFGQSKESLHLW